MKEKRMKKFRDGMELKEQKRLDSEMKGGKGSANRIMEVVSAECKKYACRIDWELGLAVGF